MALPFHSSNVTIDPVTSGLDRRGPNTWIGFERLPQIMERRCLSDGHDGTGHSREENYGRREVENLD